MAGELKGYEKRVTKRLPIRVLVEYESTEDFLIDYTANVSVGGMFIQTDAPLPLGSRFRLRFRVPPRSRVMQCSSCASSGHCAAGASSTTLGTLAIACTTELRKQRFAVEPFGRMFHKPAWAATWAMPPPI